jgi:hypothetical protein
MCHALVLTPEQAQTKQNMTWTPNQRHVFSKALAGVWGTLRNPCSRPCPPCLLPPLPTDQIANIQKNTDHLSLSILEKIQYERTTSYCFECLNMQSIILSNDRAQEATQASQKAYKENKEKAPELKGQARGRTAMISPPRGCHRPPLQELQPRPPPQAPGRQYERTTSYCFEYLNMQSIILSNDRAQEATQASQKAYQENKEKALELKGHKRRGRTATTGPPWGCHRPPLQHLDSRPPPQALGRQPDMNVR